MENKREKKSFSKLQLLCFAGAAVLLLGSTVGSTRAALNYYSEDYAIQLNMSSIGVTLLENGTEISRRDYISSGTWNQTENAVLLENLLEEEEQILPGKKYPEALSVRNSGDIDTFVRVVLTKSWQDAQGNKVTTLSPDLIELNILEENGWQIADVESSPERIVVYNRNMLKAGTDSPALTDTLAVSGEIARQVTKVVNQNTVSYVYDYNGYTFHVEAEVNAVQTHNAADAVKSAWGVDVKVSSDETRISLK